MAPLTMAEITKLAPRRESAIQKEVLRYLKARKVFAWKAGAGGTHYREAGSDTRFVRFGLPGQSDIMGVLPGGRFLALEIKRPDGKVTRQQSAFLLKVQSLGGVAAVVSDVATVERILNEEGVR